jgi:hypothetical protein
MAKCPIHNTEFKFVPAGTSKKTGKPYPGFYACSTMGCKEKPTQAQQATPDAKFNRSLDETAAYEDRLKKDKTITRLAIAKSLIEAGKVNPDTETVGIFNRWMDLIEKGYVKPETFSQPTVTLPDADIPVEDLPF